MSRTLIHRLYVAVLVTMAVVFAQPLYAQSTGDSTAQWGNWWFGLYGGVNYSSFSGELNGFGQVQDPPSTFDAGNGIGLALGGVLEYNPGKLLGFNLLLGYDARPIDFDQIQSEVATDKFFTEDLSTSFSYLVVEPSLRINLGSRFFHVLLGPGFGFNLGKGSEY